MNRIALVIGHGPSLDKGAENTASGVTELSWNRDLAFRIAQAIGSRAVVAIIPRQVEGVPPTAAVNEFEADAAVELHLNAFNGKASGTEMVYYPGSLRGKTLALLLQHAATSVLALPDRGVRLPVNGVRGVAFLRGTRCPAVIVESFFIDNDSDLAVGTSRKSQLAQAYAEALLSFLC